jgi:F0F1-type ATP synthase assembly protein I
MGIPRRESGVPDLVRHMPNPNDNFLARSFGVLQENVRRAGPAASAGYTLIGAIAVLGGAGHLVDRWAETSSPWFLLCGMLLGVVVGFYELAKTVWKK